MEVEVPRNFRQNSCELKVKNMKFKAKAKNNNLVLKVSATGGEAFNENAVSQFTALGLNTFLPVTKVSKKAVQFEGPVAITLAKRLATPVGGYDFLLILEQIVLANRTLTANNFPIFHMAMTAEKVFFVEETGELKFVYIPLEAGFTGENMIDFINSLITMAKPADSVANDVILRFGDYFKGLMPFHIDAVESFVEAENPHVVEALRHLGPATQAIDTDSDETVILGANAGFVPDSDDTVVLDSGANYGTRIEEIAEREGVIFADENSAEAFDAMDLDGDPSVEAFVVGETYEPIDLSGAVPVQPAETYEPVDLGGVPIEETEPLNVNENADFGVPVEPVDLSGAVPVQSAGNYEPINLGGVPIEETEPLNVNENADFGVPVEPVDLGGAVPVQPAENYEPVDLSGVPIEETEPLNVNENADFGVPVEPVDLGGAVPVQPAGNYEPINLGGVPIEETEPLNMNESADIGVPVEPVDLSGAVPVQPAESYEPVNLGSMPIELNNGVGAQTEQGFTESTDFDFNSPLMTVTEPLDDASAESAEPITEKTAEPEPISEPEPVVTVQPTVEPEITPEPVATVQPTVEPEITPEPVANITAEPEPVATVQPTDEPELIPEPVVTVQPTVEPEPISEPEPVVTVQPTVEPEPVANITAEPERVNTTVEPETTPEPVVNITAEPEPVVSVEEMNGAKTEDDFYDDVTEVLYTPPATPPEKKGRLVQAVLVVQSTGQKAVINSNKFTIGKSLGCDLTIKNSNVSREHATIFFDGMDFYVADNASTNGTHLNGVLLSPNEWHKMAVDDRLSLANEIVDFLIEEREQ